MIKYFKNSIEKFRQDILSKALYDILKCFLGLTLALFVAKLIPVTTSFGIIINRSFKISFLNFLLIMVLCFALTLFVTLISSRKRYKILQQDNYTDELTGMLNYKAFKDIFPKSIEICKTQKQNLSLIIIDIDNFKQFNTRFGYQIADSVLTKVGNLLKSDSRVTDISFRQYLKGDEFIVIAKETELSNAVIAANRKRNLFKTGIDINGQIHWLTVSCGVTEYNLKKDTQESVLIRLNNALQIAKSKRDKNCVESLI